jgi:hypothetical protein
MTPRHRSLHRAGHTGSLWAATLPDVGGHRARFHLRDTFARPIRTYPIVILWTGEARRAALLLAIVASPLPNQAHPGVWITAALT